jgi:signal transduction histidine kinase
MKLARLFPGSSISAALLTGFVVVFTLGLLSGFELLRSARDAERRVNSLTDAYARGEQTLSTVRTNVLLGSIYLRDGLIDTGTVTRQFYRDELRQIRTEIEDRLRGYVSEVELPIERREWEALQRALDDYWNTLDLLFGPDAPRTYVQGTGLLRRQVVPARENILQIVERIAALQSFSRERQRVEASLLYDQVRARFVAVGAATIIAAVVVAALAFRRVRRLEAELHRRRLAEAENRLDLERLSARLVDAQEQERRHLARELHDEVGQALTAVKMDLGVALRGTRAEPRVRASLEEARGIVDTTLQGVRNLSQLLHPSVLDDFGLPETLSAYIRAFSQRSDIRVDLSHDGVPRRLPTDVEVCLYRIVQEALTNVARHSEARGARVVLAWRDDVVRATVEDDGRGLPRENEGVGHTRGLGIIGMRERAQSLGGRFVIMNRSEGGTRVVASVPVSTVPAEAERLAG